jgi:hypothetical protein
MHIAGRIDVEENWNLTGFVYPSMASLMNLEENLGSLALNPTANFALGYEESNDLAEALSITHNDETIQKVRHSLSNVGLDDEQITYAINDMQNKGFLFRERK